MISPARFCCFWELSFFRVEAFSPCFLRFQVIYTRDKDDYDVDGDDGW